jgi:hypothetical protein
LHFTTLRQNGNSKFKWKMGQCTRQRPRLTTRTWMPPTADPLPPHHVTRGDRSEPQHCFHATSAPHSTLPPHPFRHHFSPKIEPLCSRTISPVSHHSTALPTAILRPGDPLYRALLLVQVSHLEMHHCDLQSRSCRHRYLTLVSSSPLSPLRRVPFQTIVTCSSSSAAVVGPLRATSNR